MSVYVLMISQLAPIVLWISACLFIGRYSYDQLSRRSHAQAARAAFGGILAVGGVVTVALLIPVFCLLWAGISYRRADWPAVDAAYRRYASIGARVTPAMAAEWADALMNERRYGAAAKVMIQGSAKRGGKTVLKRETVVMIGACLYYEGKLGQAENALRVSSGTVDEYLRTYFLGRIAERRGAIADARSFYAQSHTAAPRFFPAVYCAVRLDLMTGAVADAQRLNESFLAADPGAIHNPAFVALDSAVRRGGPPPAPVEFYVSRI